jgi:hypothetical protein
MGIVMAQVKIRVNFQGQRVSNPKITLLNEDPSPYVDTISRILARQLMTDSRFQEHERGQKQEVAK